MRRHSSRIKRRALERTATTTAFTDSQRNAHVIKLGRRCIYCGGPFQHLDHFVPLSRGGAHGLSNLVPSCQLCNLRKHDKLPTEWLRPKLRLAIEEMLRKSYGGGLLAPGRSLPAITADFMILGPQNRTPHGLTILARTTLRRLCAEAGIPCRITGGPSELRRIVLHTGTDHFLTPTVTYVGLGKHRARDPVRALRALEILAHGFHDYGARECVCGRGLFVAPTRTGRPRLGPQAMSAAERMRNMRARRHRKEASI
jgi:hypothetical protein